jgi:hypothetical protein
VGYIVADIFDEYTAKTIVEILNASLPNKTDQTAGENPA